MWFKLEKKLQDSCFSSLLFAWRLFRKHTTLCTSGFKLLLKKTYDYTLGLKISFCKIVLLRRESFFWVKTVLLIKCKVRTQIILRHRNTWFYNNNFKNKNMLYHTQLCDLQNYLGCVCILQTLFFFFFKFTVVLYGTVNSSTCRCTHTIICYI